MNAPYTHTKLKRDEDGKDWAIALIPIMIWSVFMFGARVISLSVIACAFALGFDFITRRYILKMPFNICFDIMAGVYGILAVFAMPVTIPLWMPVVSSLLVVMAKNIRIIWKRRLFNPFIFSAALMHLFFSGIMNRFTRPFAYFSAFQIQLDEALIEKYRVITPLQYMADGSVYEDGIMSQIYGFVSGNIGEIAVTAIILAAIWLFIRKQANPIATISLLAPLLLLGLLFPSDDAESNYYAYSILFSGANVYLAVFAMNERQTMPISSIGRVMIGVICGCAIFTMRKIDGSTEWGYIILLILNIISPFIERITKPKPVGFVKE